MAQERDDDRHRGELGGHGKSLLDRVGDVLTAVDVGLAEVELHRVGEPCAGPGDHTSCDTAPGAADGLCDACPIAAGVTTENEMFILQGWFYLPN